MPSEGQHGSDTPTAMVVALGRVTQEGTRLSASCRSLGLA